MTGPRRRATEQREVRERSDLAFRILVVATPAAGLAGLVGFFRAGETSWPKPLAFGWFAVLATGLVIELLRRRRASRSAATATGTRRRSEAT